MTSTGWLWVFVGCAAAVGIVAAVKYSSKDEVKVKGFSRGIDLDQVIETFKQSGGQKDLKQFEMALNAKGLYPSPITVGWAAGRPAILGYVDVNNNRYYEPGVDKQVFRLEIERPGEREYRIIATDGYYYRHHSILGDIATLYLAGSLMNALWYRHYTVYGPAPRVVYRYSYAPRGYYRSAGYRSPGYSRGSWGGRSSSGRFGGK